MVHPIVGDIPSNLSSNRHIITKQYKKWLVSHHPDKADHDDPLDIFNIKEYGSTFLANDENEDKWILMEIFTDIFSKYNQILRMNVEEIQNLSEDIGLLISTIYENTNITSDVVPNISMEIISMLDFLCITSYCDW